MFQPPIQVRAPLPCSLACQRVYVTRQHLDVARMVTFNKQNSFSFIGQVARFVIKLTKIKEIAGDFVKVGRYVYSGLGLPPCGGLTQGFCLAQPRPACNMAPQSGSPDRGKGPAPPVVPYVGSHREGQPIMPHAACAFGTPSFWRIAQEGAGSPAPPNSVCTLSSRRVLRRPWPQKRPLRGPCETVLCSQAYVLCHLPRLVSSEHWLLVYDHLAHNCLRPSQQPSVPCLGQAFALPGSVLCCAVPCCVVLALFRCPGLPCGPQAPDTCRGTGVPSAPGGRLCRCLVLPTLAADTCSGTTSTLLATYVPWVHAFAILHHLRAPDSCRCLVLPR